MTPNDVILRVVQAVEVIISRFVWGAGSGKIIVTDI
jgi:hypothetical protein